MSLKFDLLRRCFATSLRLPKCVWQEHAVQTFSCHPGVREALFCLFMKLGFSASGSKEVRVHPLLQSKKAGSEGKEELSLPITVRIFWERTEDIKLPTALAVFFAIMARLRNNCGRVKICLLQHGLLFLCQRRDFRYVYGEQSN